VNYPKKPNYSKSLINKAGDTLRSQQVDSPEYKKALKIVNIWRKSHVYPMQTFNVTLRRKAKAMYSDAIVARRLKRLQTIIDKISNRQGHMALSRMQDIGGVRVIMKDVDQVYKMKGIYTKPGAFTHKLKSFKDYINTPQESGYRGIHLIFEFYNSRSRNKDGRCWDGLKIEMQIRTELQHAWATGIEIVSMMRGENLKAGQGNKEWLSLFQCISSIIALIEGQSTLLQHQGMYSRDLFEQTTKLADRLQAEHKILAWVAMMYGTNKIQTQKRQSFFYAILALDIKQKKMRIYGYGENDLMQATQKLEELERNSPEQQPVLAAAGNIKSLYKAYPNYLLDAGLLLKLIRYTEEVQKNSLMDNNDELLKRLRQIYKENKKLT
jgi:relA/spoT domain protein